MFATGTLSYTERSYEQDRAATCAEIRRRRHELRIVKRPVAAGDRRDFEKK
jgi:hypothetical protein